MVASGNGGHYKDNCNFDGYANSIFTVTIGKKTTKKNLFLLIIFLIIIILIIIYIQYSNSCKVLMIEICSIKIVITLKIFCPCI